MNQILFGLALILFNFIAAYATETSAMAIDLLPDFAGYLIIWLMLEKRRFNRYMKGLYAGIAFMIPVSFLFFLAQIQGLFINGLTQVARNTGWKLLGIILSGFAYVYTEYYGLVMLIAVLLTGWLLFALLEYWTRTNQHKLKGNVCRIGMGIGAITALCHAASALIILPFSWNLITYPLSLLLLVCVWFAMKDVSEIETPSRT